VTLLNECTKTIAKLTVKKDVSKYIPACSIVFGIILGIAGYYTTGVDMGNNIVEAIFIGISAGAAATGIHQVGKQLNKTDEAHGLSPEEMIKFIGDSINVCDGTSDEEDVSEDVVSEIENPGSEE